MKQNAMALLQRLTRAPAKKEERLTDLLRDPKSDSTPGWFMHVPTCFNEALDIRQTPRKIDGKIETVWTQGGSFAFKVGDMIYDTPLGYVEWTRAVRHISLCVQITSATGAVSPQPQSPRITGSVKFDVFVRNSDETGLLRLTSHVLSQDDFVRFLITGEGVPR